MGASLRPQATSTGATVATRGVYLLSFMPESDVERIVEFDLNADEKAMFEKSVAAVNGLLDACKKLEPSLA
jgi:malate/lactate dehydrogenase